MTYTPVNIEPVVNRRPNRGRCQRNTAKPSCSGENKERQQGDSNLCWTMGQPPHSALKLWCIIWTWLEKDHDDWLMIEMLKDDCLLTMSPKKSALMEVWNLTISDLDLIRQPPVSTSSGHTKVTTRLATLIQRDTWPCGDASQDDLQTVPEDTHHQLSLPSSSTE